MDALRPECCHCALADQLGAISAELFRKIGDCRLPIKIGPAVAPQFFASWDTLTDLRIEKHRWVLASDGRALMEHFEIVTRYVSRARIRVGP